MMELLFKPYTDKPSRLGITYSYPYQAKTNYELLLSKGASQQFHLNIEILSSTIKLILTSEQNGYSSTYKDVGFKPEQLKRLISAIQQKSPIEFVHVYKEGNAPLVAKPFGKQKFISITSADIFSSGSFKMF